MDTFVTLLRAGAVEADAFLTAVLSVHAQVIAMLVFVGTALFVLAKLVNEQTVLLRMVARVRALLGPRLGDLLFGNYAKDEPWPVPQAPAFRMAMPLPEAGSTSDSGISADVAADEDGGDVFRRLGVTARQLAAFKAALEGKKDTLTPADEEDALRVMAAAVARLRDALANFCAAPSDENEAGRADLTSFQTPLEEGEFHDLADILKKERPGLIAPSGALRAQSESRAVFYASAFAALGDLMMAGGQYEDALSAFRQALDAVHPHDLMERAKFLHKYANAAYRAGKVEMAKQAFFDELNILELERGAAHPDVATAFNNLGLLHYESGEMDTAERLLRKAIAAKTKNGDLVGAQESRQNLAQVLRATGRHEEAAGLAAQDAEPSSTVPPPVPLKEDAKGASEEKLPPKSGDK